MLQAAIQKAKLFGFGFTSVALFSIFAGAEPVGKLITCQERVQKQKFRQVVRSLASSQQFSQLEQMGQELLSKKARFPDGEPKLEVFYEQVSSSDISSKWSAALKHQNLWVSKYRHSARAKIARARFYIAYAWNARGMGYADTVEEEGWRLFRERLALAERNLREAQRDDPSDPYGYIYCITIAMANGWDRKKVDALVAKAMAVFPGCDSALERTAHYLMPRWQGSPGDLESFADRWSAKNEASYSIVWGAVQGLSDVMDETQFSWPKLKASYEARLKNFRSEIVMNRYARDAYRFGDTPTAYKLMRELKNHWDPNAWNNDQEQFNQLRKKAAQRSQ